MPVADEKNVSCQRFTAVIKAAWLEEGSDWSNQLNPLCEVPEWRRICLNSGHSQATANRQRGLLAAVGMP